MSKNNKYVLESAGDTSITAPTTSTSTSEFCDELNSEDQFNSW